MKYDLMEDGFFFLLKYKIKSYKLYIFIFEWCQIIYFEEDASPQEVGTIDKNNIYSFSFCDPIAPILF